MKLEFEPNTSTIEVVENDSLNKTDSGKHSSEAAKMLEAGVKLAQEGRSAEARNLLLRATEADPENESAWMWLASISEYPEELLVFLNSVLKINPHNERALEWAKSTKSLLSKTFVQRGVSVSKEDQKDFAKQCFLQAIVHDNENEMAWLWLASLSDSEEEKTMYFQKVLAINPQNETATSWFESLKKQKNEALLQKAVGSAVADDYDSAHDALREMPDSEEVWVLRSFLRRSFDEKLNCYEKTLELNPENEMAQSSLLALMSLMEKTEAREAVSVVPENSEPQEFSGEAMEFAGESAEEFYDLGETREDEEYFTLAEDQNGAELAPEENPTQKLEFPPFSFQPENNFTEESADYSENTELSFDSSAAPEEAAFHSPETDEFYSFSADDASGFETVNEPVKEMQTENNEVHFEEENFSNNEEAANLNEDSSDVYQIETDELFPPESPVESDYAPKFVEEQNHYSQENYPHQEEDYSLPTEEFVGEQNENDYAAAAYEENDFQNESPKSQADVECPFCGVKNEAQAFICNSCRAALSLSDMEMVLAHQECDKERVGNAVSDMENERVEREFSADELKFLGIGYLNVKNLRKGLNCLKQAAKINPNDIVLSSQVNALAIRLADIERQESINSSMAKNRTILVVDDSATVRKLISGKLEKSGHEVVCAIDGIDALEKLQTTVPDLILLDINMPRMDGYQVCKMIRNNQPTKDVPVVMISGKDGFFDKVRGRMAGTTGYITKPFGPETLMKTVESYVTHSPSSDE